MPITIASDVNFGWNSWITPGIFDRVGTVVLAAGFVLWVVVFANHIG